jgi:hypothetical protein
MGRTTNVGPTLETPPQAEPTSTDDVRTPPDPPGRAHGPFERITVNLTVKSSQALEEAVELTDDTKTDTINKALQLWSHLQALIDRGGAVYFREPNGDLERIRFF